MTTPTCERKKTMPGADPNIKSRKRDRIGRFANEDTAIFPSDEVAPKAERARAEYMTEITENAQTLSAMQNGTPTPARTLANDDGELMTITMQDDDIYGITESGRDFPDDIVATTNADHTEFSESTRQPELTKAKQAEHVCMDSTQGEKASETTTYATRAAIGELHQRYMNAILDNRHTQSDRNMRVMASVNTATGELDITPAWQLQGHWPDTRIVPITGVPAPLADNHEHVITINPGKLDRALARMRANAPIRVGTSEEALHIAQSTESDSHLPIIMWLSIHDETGTATE